MAGKHWTAGWTRIGGVEFKVANTAALKEQPDLCVRMRRAIKATAARKGVQPKLVARYLAWIDEVEAAETTVAEAEHASAAPTPSTMWAR